MTDRRETLQMLWAALSQGHAAAVARECTARLATGSDDAEVRHLYGCSLATLERFPEAASQFQQALALRSGYVPAMIELGAALLAIGDLRSAQRVLEAARTLDPRPVRVHFLLGSLFETMGDGSSAVGCFQHAAAVFPRSADAQRRLARALLRDGNFTAAIQPLGILVQLCPEDSFAHADLGTALLAGGKFFDAAAALRRALMLDDRLADAATNLGEALLHMQQWEQAATAFQRALTLEPHQFEALMGLGKASANLGHTDNAIASLVAAQKRRPADVQTAVAVAGTLESIGCPMEALDVLTGAAMTMPRAAEVHCTRGALLHRLGRLPDAVRSYELALDIDPRRFDALLHRGWALDSLKLHSAALDSMRRAHAIEPSNATALAAIMDAACRICDWATVLHTLASLRALPSGSDALHPFLILAVDADPSRQRRCAERYAAEKLGCAPLVPMWTGKRSRRERIRIAYVSADYKEHATMHLMAGVFERHDRRTFETIAVSVGSHDACVGGRPLIAAFDRFVDVRALTNAQAATLIAELEIDIAVDLKGYTAGNRCGIFAHRPAPIQVNYLGFPGTMGTPCIDYIIADATVIPPASRTHYVESVVYLPNSYQANDRSRQISEHVYARGELGLPEKGFVFCCFNNNFKITRSTFEGWMRILNRVDDSVLWLLSDNQTASVNLRKEAGANNIDPARLIFAERMPLPEHLARHRAAGLFLDTLPYTAHTTASDALWAGLPVLTRVQSSFASRVAASLLHAAGLSELVTTTQEQYEAMAVELATNPHRLAEIAGRLERNRLTTPLFDTELMTRNLERAYMEMMRRHEAKLPPDDIWLSGQEHCA